MRTIFLILTCVTCTLFANAQINYQPQTNKVTGTAEKLVTPNVVHLMVHLKEVRTRNLSIPLLKARNEFMKACTESGVLNEDIKLSNANSRLERKLQLWRRDKTDVIQRETYDIKFTDMNKMLACIEKLDKPFVESVNFGEQTHTEITKYRKEVKEEAAKAGIEKAKYLAKASGREVGNVIFIEELNEVNSQGLANSYSNQIGYSKKSYGGGAKVNFGFKPMALHYKVQVICELK